MKEWNHLRYTLAAVLICWIVIPGVALAVWSNNPAVNTSVTSLTGAGTKPAITTDGNGGAIITWESSSRDIYVQRIDASGNLLWEATGKALTSDGNNYNPQITTDMSGGAIVVWQKGTSGDGIYVQHVDGEGEERWSPGGEFILINNIELSGSHRNPRIVSDGQQGAIVVWEDSRSAGSTGYDIYAQRFHTYIEGDDIYYEEYWGANGQPICYEAGDQLDPQLFSDNSGGAIFVWQDLRFSKWKIIALRVDVDTANPTDGWSYIGNPVSFSDQNHVKPQITGDGSGGAIITWQVGDDGSGGIYAQRISMGAGYPWIGNQLELIVAAGQNKLQNPQIVSDGNSGAVISWLSVNSGDGSTAGIFVKRFDVNGLALWPASNGVTVASPANIDTGDPPQMVSDGNNGAIITWADHRNGSDYNIYAQRIDGSGSAQWSSDGIQVSTATNDQKLPRIISDGSSGAIITWQDQRSTDGGIYAQKLLSDGTLPVVTVAPTVTTTAVSAIALTTATSGGNVTSDGGASVTARGVCWGLTANPEIGSNCISAGSGAGSFNAGISGLIPGTPYHVRAYATNSIGTSYGEDVQFTTLAGSTLTLSMTFNGSATGRVTSNPAGIDCTTAQCPSALFVNDTNVTLTAAPDGDSSYAWGGDCVVTDGKCTVTMGGDKSASVTFNYVQTVRIEGSSAPYVLIGGAYSGLPDGGGTIQARVHEFTEELNINRSLPVVIKGGYDTSYSGNSGITTVKGSITLTNGSLTVENLAIR